MAEARRVYQLSDLSLPAINFLLSQLGDRLDQLEGYRGTPTFKSDLDLQGNRGKNAGSGSDSTDLANVGQISSLALQLWPIGAIYLSIISTNPGIYLGGTWIAVGTGKVLVGINAGDADFTPAEKTGGAKTHKHSVDVPATTSGGPSGTVQVSDLPATITVATATHTHQVDPAAVDSTTVSNVMPYYVVYVWKRTA